MPDRVREETLPGHVRALLDGSAYPRIPGSIELIQTHISWVFLADDDVFKLKKPVDLGFVDFTSLEARRRACEAEVRLNRRGCPGGVYLGVEAVTLADGLCHIGGAGETVDYAVHMKRLPRDRMMDRLLAEDRVGFTMIGRLAGRVAELHVAAETGPAITAAGGYETLARNWRDNLARIRRFVGTSLGRRRFRRIESYAARFLNDERPLLESREQAGWVRDCHGDMRSDSVCFDDTVPGGICIFDCIEFNDAFRYGDTGLDVAFLAMDLDYRGRPDLADLFIGLYAAAIGDASLPLLLNFYKCHRACVRGLVEGLISQDAGISRRDRAAARSRARAYFALAESYARRPPARFVMLVVGPSGSGKSVLAGALAAHHGAILLATDVVRRGLVDEPGAERYSAASRDRVYREMAGAARDFVAGKRAVVLDATFTKVRERATFLQIARDAAVPLLVVECQAPDEVVRERQARRRNETWSASEGHWEVYLQQKAGYEPLDEIPDGEKLIVDTSLPLTEQVALVDEALAFGEGASSP